MRQLELIRRESLAEGKAEGLVPRRVDNETLRELVALMAEAILTVARSPEVDDE